MSEEIDRENGEKNAGDRSGTRQSKRSSLTVSKFIAILAVVVFVLLVIVNNSVTVDKLVSGISSLDSTYKEIKFQNDSLQAELKKLSSAERITQIASEKLGLVYSSQTLDKIEIDRNKLDEAERKDARDTTK